jgi:outer membrane protein assembly factor BamB
LLTGKLLWSFSEGARYFTPIAGEGPRATPTVVRDKVYALGATGRLHCLDLASGKPVWSQDIKLTSDAKMPEWGYSGSPLSLSDWIIVSAGGGDGKSLVAFRTTDGGVAWSGGSAGANYSSPFYTTLAGTPQILSFNSGRITSHNAGNGAVLWEHKWGVGMPHVAMPVVTGPDTVLFSSGYGVGSELLKVTNRPDGTLGVTNVWSSKKMKAKFANLVARDGFLYGLDDGIMACLDLKDGSQRWKEGRYGHGQGLMVGDLFLLMSEGGELVLMRPTPQAPGELHKLKIFTSKTWNPIALSGELLIVRNDTEAVCLELALKK